MKKLGKIICAVLLMAAVLSTLQLTVLASETDTAATATPAVDATAADSADTPATPTTGAVDTSTPAAPGVEVALYLMENNNDWSVGDIDPTVWSEPVSESVFITEDGTYTLSITDLVIPADNLCLCYIKDVAAYPKDTTVTHSNVPDDLMVITNEFRVNGNKKEVDSSKVRTGLSKGIFDVAYHNDWGENDCSVSFTTDISSVEVTFTVTGITGEPGAITWEPTQAPTPTAAAAASATDTGSKSDAPAASDNTAASTADSSDSSPYILPIAIGIAAAAVVIVILIIVIRKKRK